MTLPDAVAAPGGGLIGMAACPVDPADRDAIQAWGAVCVVTLVPAAELAQLGLADPGAEWAARGIAWHHAPIADYQPPGAAFETAWRTIRPRLAAHLAADRRILLHCRAGLGRTGTVAARLLVELGEPPDAAIARIRRARPGAIETPAQESHLRDPQAPWRRYAR